MTDIVYSIKENRIKNSILKEMLHKEKNILVTTTDEEYHYVAFPPLDGGETNTSWGRLCFDLEHSLDTTYFVYVLAQNEKISFENQNPVEVLEMLGAGKSTAVNDLLLYEYTGRYLYIAIEIYGQDEAVLTNVLVDKQGDNFMNTFPGIYQERNSFFHRYLSIFSSIYNDFGKDIRDLPKLLDLDHCPEELLTMYGKWLGIDIDCDIQESEIKRQLVKEAYELNKLKGTKLVINRLAKIMLQDEVIVLEKNIMQKYEEEENLPSFNELFGNNVYNVCVLLNKDVNEVKKSQFKYILNQFLPVRVRLKLVSLKREGELDFHSYLDMNAKLYESKEGFLDEAQAMDQAITLL